TPHQVVTITNLSSDQAGSGSMVADLVNAWGLAINPDALGGPFFWVVANETGEALVYDRQGAAQTLVVKIPGPDGGTSAPTGEISNPTPAFKGDKFVFCSEDGTIAGWKTGTNAVTRVTAANANYKGLAMLVDGSDATLAVANFKSGQ